MEFFRKAKSVRLRSYHHKYLIADDDQEKVIQDRSGKNKMGTWTVEFVEDFDDVVRLRSCYDKYLTATDEQCLLGVTGSWVKQTMPSKPDSSIAWEPLREGVNVKLKTRYGNFLRANGGLPPWRNSITHDIPHRHRDWILWSVEVVEYRQEPQRAMPMPIEEDVDLSDLALTTPGLSRSRSFDLEDCSSEGRTVYYRVVDEEGDIDTSVEESSFIFKGHGIDQLTSKLEEETGQEGITVCLQNKFNGQLNPLRLSLPPNNATMSVVVVPSTSKLAATFLPESSTCWTVVGRLRAALL